jgi:hypothetical protein
VTDFASYVYLAARDIPDDAVAGVTGIEDAPVRLVRKAGLTAVVSTVDLAEFGEDALRQNLEDLDWLEMVARTHDEVINWFAQVTTVAPWRLATIMLDDDRVAVLLEVWQEELRAALDRIQGCSEWSVQMFVDPAGADTADSADLGQETGTAYLQRRRSETYRQAEATHLASVEADQIHQTLSRLTAASRRLPPQDQRLTGHRGEMVLNGAYLVPDDQSGEFGSLVQQLSDTMPGSRLELKGPWPAYSFATLEPGAAS